MDLAAFVGGLLAGWLGEWVLDWLYWRRRKPAMATAGDDPAFAKRLESLDAENRDLKARLAVAPTVHEKLVHIEREHLQDIYGIGPVYQKRLTEAGITTFDQLADANPKELIKIAKIQEWQAADPNSWVSQARDFADRRKDSE